MTDYMELSKVHATLAEDAAWPWKRSRYATLSMMYAALANAQCMDRTMSIQRDMANLQREALEGPMRMVQGEFQFWYEDDPNSVILYGAEADEFLHGVNDGKYPEIVKVEYRSKSLWAQVYPVIHV